MWLDRVDDLGILPAALLQQIGIGSLHVLGRIAQEALRKQVAVDIVDLPEPAGTVQLVPVLDSLAPRLFSMQDPPIVQRAEVVASLDV